MTLFSAQAWSSTSSCPGHRCSFLVLGPSDTDRDLHHPLPGSPNEYALPSPSSGQCKWYHIFNFVLHVFNAIL